MTMKKGSIIKKSITLIFATDERDAMIQAIIEANLVARIKV